MRINFIDRSKQNLQRIQSEFSGTSVQLQWNFKKSKRIQWNFSPPTSPQMNGAIEAIVKNTTKALKTVIRDPLFTEEMLAIYLTQIESFINKRLLIPISDNVSL